MGVIAIGSRAIKYWYPDYRRTPSDWDYVTDKIHLYKRKHLLDAKRTRTDYHEINPLEKYITTSTHSDSKYMKPEQLLALKLSHIRYDIKWDKHFGDILFLLSKNVIPDMNLLTELSEHWEGVHGEVHILGTLPGGANNFYVTLFESEHSSDQFKINEIIYLSDILGSHDEKNTKGATRMSGFKELIRMSPTWVVFFIIHNYKQILNNFKQF